MDGNRNDFNTTNSMKIRAGFISNSSSSSYIVLLPKNFDADLFVDNLSDDIYNRICQYDKYTKSEIRVALKQLVSDGIIYQYDNYKEKSICQEALDDFVIASIEGGPDDGKISIVDDEEREKIKKLINLELRYDKLKEIENGNT